MIDAHEALDLLRDADPGAASLLGRNPPPDRAALAAVLAEAPPRVEAHLLRVAQTLADARDALVFLPLCWTWFSVGLAFLTAPSSSTRTFLDVWQASAIGPGLTFAVTACLIGSLFVLSLAVPVLERASGRRVAAFREALELLVADRLEEVRREEMRRGEELIAAFADAPEHVRAAGIALADALDREARNVTELVEVRTAEVSAATEARAALEGIVAALHAAADALSGVPERIEAAFNYVAAKLEQIGQVVVNLQSLLDELQRDREATVALLRDLARTAYSASARWPWRRRASEPDANGSNGGDSCA